MQSHFPQIFIVILGQPSLQLLIQPPIDIFQHLGRKHEVSPHPGCLSDFETIRIDPLHEMIGSLHEALQELQLDGSSGNLGLDHILLLILVVIGDLRQQILIDQFTEPEVANGLYIMHVGLSHIQHQPLHLIELHLLQEGDISHLQLIGEVDLRPIHDDGLHYEVESIHPTHVEEHRS